MASVQLRFGIPDLELGCASGQKINPSDFAGHDLLALFCPLDPGAAALEITAYRSRSSELVNSDAWLLTFTDHCDDLSPDRTGNVSFIRDPENLAWFAFRDLTGHPEEFDRNSGAIFLFSRGGGLHRYWHGAGRVDEVLAELQTPPFGNGHQLAG